MITSGISRALSRRRQSMLVITHERYSLRPLLSSHLAMSQRSLTLGHPAGSRVAALEVALSVDFGTSIAPRGA
eukprot:233805-Rhodomonas_salina.1